MTDFTDTGQVGAAGASRPNGAAAAALVAAGIGATLMGLMTTLSEASTSIANALDWSDAVGPLAGKTIVSAAAFFAVWIVLHLVLNQRNVNLMRVFWIAIILIVIGVIGTMPTFFQIFGTG